MNTSTKHWISRAVAALLLVILAAPVLAQEIEPQVLAGDQPILEGTVVIDKVTSPAPGFVAVYNQGPEGERPGEIIGYAAVPEGESDFVIVEIDETAATDVLYALLHADAGVAGTFEYPADDAVVLEEDGEVVGVPFEITPGEPGEEDEGEQTGELELEDPGEEGAPIVGEEGVEDDNLIEAETQLGEEGAPSEPADDQAFAPATILILFVVGLLILIGIFVFFARRGGQAK